MCNSLCVHPLVWLKWFDLGWLGSRLAAQLSLLAGQLHNARSGVQRNNEPLAWIIWDMCVYTYNVALCALFLFVNFKLRRYHRFMYVYTAYTECTQCVCGFRILTVYKLCKGRRQYCIWWWSFHLPLCVLIGGCELEFTCGPLIFPLAVFSNPQEWCIMLYSLSWVYIIGAIPVKKWCLHTCTNHSAIF